MTHELISAKPFVIETWADAAQWGVALLLVGVLVWVCGGAIVRWWRR